MPLIRSDRSDRRRRVMREAAATDAGVAVESVRAVKRRRMRENEEAEMGFSAKRDPGYSQAVRRACQQRLVQLIPVRRFSLILTIAGLWTIWATLMLAHYFVHVQPIGKLNAFPIAYLFHMRSIHGIAHWLGGQLWTLTALASLMIFQLRRHKLDDYRAKYRVWGLLAIAAIVSSLDVSSSGLRLLGMSIDSWSRREVGYSGWAVVLVTFATLVGILGLRICSEIKTAPLSVVFWLGGLIAWATSALIGTDLMASPWNQNTTDMVVGGAWLGGILSVFLAGGIYLRHIYIQAQKRFILRNGMLAKRKAWKLPRLSRRNRSEQEEIESANETGRKSKSKNLEDQETTRESRAWLPWKRRHKDEVPGSNTQQSSRKNRTAEDQDIDETTEERSDSKRVRDDNRNKTDESSNKRSWLRMPRWKSDPRLGDDYSDVASERRKRDEGFEEPLAKKSGWFSKKQTAGPEKAKQSQDRDLDRQEDRRSERRQTLNSSSQRDDDHDSSLPDFKEVREPRSSWWKRSPKAEKPNKKKERSAPESGAETAKNKRRWFQKSTKPKSESSASGGQSQAKKSWGLLKKKKSATEKSDGTNAHVKSTDIKPKRKVFGFFDKLKLKPPTDESKKSAPVPVSATRAPVPSSSAAQRHETPKVEPSYNDSRHSHAMEEEDYEDDGNRSLSKAERKRLRRQQQENRRAA